MEGRNLTEFTRFSRKTVMGPLLLKVCTANSPLPFLHPVRETNSLPLAFYMPHPQHDPGHPLTGPSSSSSQATWEEPLL